MLAKKELYDEARTEFKKVIEQHPEDLFAHDSLASMELYINDPEAAREALEIFFIKGLKPDRKILKVMLETNQARLKLEKLSPSYPEIRSELIETYLLSYKTDKRPEHLLESAELALVDKDFETAAAHLKNLLTIEDLPAGLSVKASDLLNNLKQKDDLP